MMRQFMIASLACALTACPPPRATEVRGPSGTLEGIVLGADGRPAAGAIVIVTDATSSRRVAVLTANGSGFFTASAPRRPFSITAASASGFAWIESIEPGSAVRLQLSTNCSQVSGVIRDADRHSAPVYFTRIGLHQGDVFGLRIGDSGKLQGCLPKGVYMASLGDGLFALPTLVRPPADSVVLSAFSEEVIKSPLPPDGAPEVDSGEAAFIDAIAASDAVVIGLGEANHGTADFQILRGRLTIGLASSTRLRHIILEADAIGVGQLNDYVQGVSNDARAGLTAMGMWIWDTEEMVSFLEDLRRFNSERQASDRINLWGLDVQDLAPSAVLLADRATDLSLADSETALLREISQGDRSPTLDDSRVTSLLTTLERLRGHNEPRVAVAAVSLTHQLRGTQVTELADQLMYRDMGMASVAAKIVSFFPNDRVCIWAHSGHVAREPYSGMQSMGQVLAAEFGDDYLPIALLSTGGSARAWDPELSIGVVENQLSVAPIYSVEGALRPAVGLGGSSYVLFNTLPGDVRRWLQVPRLVREFGAQYDDEEFLWVLRNILTAFDAAVVVENATAAVPTPTGVRSVSK